jgi:hypothetical protein
VGSPTWKFPCAYCKQHESWQIWPSLPSTKCVWHYHRNYGVTREVLALAPCKIARCLWQESIYNNLLTMVFQILTFALMSNTRMSAGMFAKHNGKLVHQISVCPPKHMVNSGTMFQNIWARICAWFDQLFSQQLGLRYTFFHFLCIVRSIDIMQLQERYGLRIATVWTFLSHVRVNLSIVTMNSAMRSSCSCCQKKLSRGTLHKHKWLISCIDNVKSPHIHKHCTRINHVLWRAHWYLMY